MRNIFLFLFTLTIGAALCVQHANAQVTTNSGSGLSPTYGSLDLAIAALNAATITSPVVITLSGNETAPAGGYAITQAGGTLANTIIIQGSGSTITAFSPQSSGNLNDAIFKIIGGDYITIQGFTMNENAANTTPAAATNNMTEWGVALLYASATNGAQHNTIQNNTISLNRIYLNTFGIYSNTRHTAADVLATAEATDFPGSNSYNKAYSNSISNVNFGIVFIGAGTNPTAIDIGNDIGGSSLATGNTITNWGGGSALSLYVSLTAGNYCIFANQQINDNISFNTITSASVSVLTIQIGGIFKAYSVASPVGGVITSNINDNTVTLTNSPTTSQMTAITSQGLLPLSTVTQNINNNKILNCSILGTSATSAAFVGILTIVAPGTLNINGNTIRGISTSATTGLYSGIQQQTNGVINALNINNNNFGDNIAGAFTFTRSPYSGSVNCITVTNTGAAATCAISASNNNFQGFVYPSASSGAFQCINIAATGLTQTINSNNFNNLTVNTSATTYGFMISANNNTPTTTIDGNYVTTQFTNANTTGAVNYLAIANIGGLATTGISTISNNTISNVTFKTTTSFGTMIYWINGTGATCTHNIVITGNTFSNISNTGTGTATQAAGLYAISVSAGFANVISNNTVFNINAAGGGAYGILTFTGSSNPAGTYTVNNNLVYNIKSTSFLGSGYSAAGSATGIFLQAGAAMNNVYKNKIYDISCVVASGLLGGPATGMIISSSTSAGLITNVYNNYVGRIYSDNSIYFQAVRGIAVQNTIANRTNLYYNTVYLDGVPGFFSICFYKSSSLTNVDLRNNIFVNNCIGSSAVEQLVIYEPSLTASYLSTSNNNLLYCGTPGPLKLIYANGSFSTPPLTNPKQTLAAFKAFVGPTRESNSISQVVPFLNTLTGSGSNYLHVDPAVATSVESGAINIATYTDDYDGDIRQGNPGYAGTGTAPDIGADEFNGIGLPICSGDPAASTIDGPISVCSGTGTTLSLSSVYTGLGITFQWKYATTPGGPYTNLGTNATQATGALTVATYYICTIICTNGGGSFTTAEKTVTVEPFPPTASASSNAPVCAGATLNLTGVTDIGTSFSWTGTNGFTSTLQNPVISSASVPGIFESRTYQFIATKNGCSSTPSTITVVVNPYPAAITVTPPSSTITPGGIQLLTASGGKTPSTGSTGIGPLSTQSGSPYKGFYGGTKTQNIYLSSELTAMGLTAGCEITSISFYVKSFTGPYTFNNFTIALKNTSTSNLTSTMETGTTTVLAPSSLTLSGTAPMIVTHTFTSPFTWNGTSNLLVETCFNNNDAGGVSGNTAVMACRNNAFFSLSSSFSADSDPLLCSSPGVATPLFDDRLDIDLGFNVPASIKWTPFTGLFTNPAATVPYTGSVTNTVYASPAVTTTYTATAAYAAACPTTANATVNLSGVPVNNTIQDITLTGSECYDATNTITVAGGGTSFIVSPTGSATFIAGVKISFLPGTKVQSNGYLLGKISTSYCGAATMMQAHVTGQDETPFSPVQSFFTIYPNPTNGNFTLVQKGDRQYGNVNVAVYGMHGEKVLSMQMIGEKKHEFVASELPAGLYFVKVVADDYTETIKLVKTR
ncbi:MAG: T9SS type A sorting domain-containing protein [Bacteroidetes bacterium]|nr:T9SS type A sorting domain-containing protein [Bacteroidota bacterium]